MNVLVRLGMDEPDSYSYRGTPSGADGNPIAYDSLRMVVKLPDDSATAKYRLVSCKAGYSGDAMADVTPVPYDGHYIMDAAPGQIMDVVYQVDSKDKEDDESWNYSKTVSVRFDSRG